MAVASDKMVPSCVEPGVSTPQTACISGESIPGCWGGHHHPSNENGLPSQPLLGPGCLWSSRQWRLANGTCSSASTGRMMGTWVSQSWNPPKILVLISEVKQHYTIYLYFFTVHLKQDYEGNRSLPCFLRCFFFHRIWWRSSERRPKRNWAKLLHLWVEMELDEFCRSNDCGWGWYCFFLNWDLIREPMVFFWTTFSLNISWREGRFYGMIWLWHSCGLLTFMWKIVLAQWQGIHTSVLQFLSDKAPQDRALLYTM